MLYGGAGDDYLRALTTESATLHGGEGNDKIIGFTGADLLTGGDLDRDVLV